MVGKPRDPRLEARVEVDLVVLKRAPKHPGLKDFINNNILKTSTFLVCVRSHPFARKTAFCRGSTRLTRGWHEVSLSTALKTRICP